MSELKGLARSFDTLFLALADSEQGTVPDSESSTTAVATAPEDPMHSDVIVDAEEFLDPFDSAPSADSTGWILEDTETVGHDPVSVDEAWETEGAGEDTSSPVDDASHAAVIELAEEPAAPTEDEAHEPVDPSDLEPVQSTDTSESDAGDSQESESDAGDSQESESDESEFVPTPLDLATEEFIAGDTARADDVESLAETCVEQRELDPVARAVASITLAAGDPPDPSIYSVAEAIMSGPVLGRLASHMGRERDEERRAEYFAVCRTIGADMAAALRADLADNTDRLARRIHCQALVEMGEPGRLVIEEMALDDNRFLVRNAVAMLGDQGGGRAVELCTSALANPDARVRKEALRSLAKLGDPESGLLVVGLLDDPDAEVRIAAAVAAGELRVDRALKPLIAMLDATKDPDEALTLIRALGRIADPSAVTSIEKHAVTSLFSKPRTDLRIASYRALNEIGTPHARRLLNQAINDKDATVKSAVKEILGIR